MIMPIFIGRYIRKSSVRCSQKAFTVGLNEPSKRITEPEWMTLFANMMSGMLRCTCGAQLFYDEALEAKNAAHICWNCQNAVPVPKKLIIGNNCVLLHQDTKNIAPSYVRGF